MTAQGPEALLQWCKTNTSGYPDVAVSNFHNSWKDGLALCALIHKFHPDNIQFDSLSRGNHMDTLEIAFATAEKLGVPRIMDPADMMLEPKPDQFSVMTYLSQVYHVFEKNDHPAMGLANIIVARIGNPTGSSTQYDNNLQQDGGTPAKGFVKPALKRSFSTPQMPSPALMGSTLQKRAPPPLMTKGGTLPKFTPPVKKAATTLETGTITLAATDAAPTPTTPTSAPTTPTSAPTTPTSAPTTPTSAPTSPTTAISPILLPTSPTSPTAKVSAAAWVSSSPSTASGTAQTSPTTKSAPTYFFPASGSLSSKSAGSTPVFRTSVSNPNISVKAVPVGKASDDSSNNQIRSGLVSPSPSPSPVPPSPSPSPVPPSPSPSPTPYENKPKVAVKVLSAKSAGEITTYRKAEEKEDSNNTPLSKTASTPNISKNPPDTKLKRSLSTSMVGWVQKYKATNNFIKIDQNVEIKKVTEHEGPLSPDETDDDKLLSPAPQKRFLVDKVSSSSRGSWVAKQSKQSSEDEEDDEYEYIDDDPSRMHEPVFDFIGKLTSCLVRTTSTGKLVLPTPKNSSKRVSFQDYEPEDSFALANSTEDNEPEIETVSFTIKRVGETPRQELTKDDSNIEAQLADAQLKATKQIRSLERERDAATFHRDEISAKYAELEMRYKEERAANDAMERETSDLHQKLSSIQQQMESKYTQQVTDMSQKLAEKEREIIRLRMQNTTMKKRVEEKEKDLERLKTSRSLSPPPELPSEDLESDNEIRKVIESAQGIAASSSPPKTVVAKPYAGLKVSIDNPNHKVSESPRPIHNASPRFDPKKESIENPFSPDLVKRTSTPPLMIKATRSFTPTKPDSPDVQRHTEIAKTFIFRPQTPTKPGDSKFVGSRPQTPTKIEIIKAKAADSTAKPAYELTKTPEPSLQRPDSQSKIMFYPMAKSPEPIKVVLSPKPSARKPKPVEVAPEDMLSPRDREGKDIKSGPGTPRTYNENSQGLDSKLPKLEEYGSSKPIDIVKPEYRAGTMRSETSKSNITYSSSYTSSSPSPSPSPINSPSPSPRPCVSPSPNNVRPPYKLGVNASSTYNPPKHTRHSSNPSHNSPPVSSPSPRPSSNPSPSQIKQPEHKSNSSPSQSPSPSPSSNGKSESKMESFVQSKASSIVSFFTRGRSNTLATEPAFLKEREENKGQPHTPVVSLKALKEAKINGVDMGERASAPSASLSQEDVSNLESPTPITRIGRSYSLSSLMPPKYTSSPTYVPKPSKVEVKPAWLVTLESKRSNK